MPSAKEQYQLAFNYTQAGRFEAAESCLRNLIIRYPDHPDVLHLLGVVLQNLDRVEESEKLLDSAVRICPRNALFHYHHGLSLIKCGRPGSAAKAFASAVRIDPELRHGHYNLAKALKDSGDTEGAIRVYRKILAADPVHVEALYNLANIYYDQERFREAGRFYADALAHAPAHTNARTNLAHVQIRQKNRAEAIENLEKVLEIEPGHLEAMNLLRRLNSELIPGWHFAMLNDTERNAAYDRAIKRVAAGARHVLEIGTGSGLLAMMAARAGARKVTTCETLKPLAQIAAKIIRKNGYAERIRVINKKSSQLKIGTDLPEPADVLIAEVFDVGLLGEHFLPALTHARRNLLSENAIIIPASAKIFALLIECPELRRVNPIKEIASFDLSDFDIFRSPGYSQVNLGDLNHRVLSEPIEICRIDFGKENPWQCIPHRSMVFTGSGTCHAIVFWFDLYLDRDTVISTVGGSKSSHWKQALYFFNEDHQVDSGMPIDLTVHIKDTGLSFDMGSKKGAGIEVLMDTAHIAA